MATKHKVNIKDILSARYRSDWIKNVRTIYKNAKSTAGSAAGWSPTTYSTMLEATKKIQYYLHKNFPLEVQFISLLFANFQRILFFIYCYILYSQSIAQDALTDTGESVNSVENENLPPHVNTVCTSNALSQQYFILRAVGVNALGFPIPITYYSLLLIIYLSVCSVSRPTESSPPASRVSPCTPSRTPLLCRPRWRSARRTTRSW